MSFAFWLTTAAVCFGLVVAWTNIDDPTTLQIITLWAAIGIAAVGTIDIFGRKN